MPTTSNFGWTTPADTDLVKDGASAIRTLGNGIDTSMAQLKGGTTGQVLSKTNGTDMAFTWTTPQVGDITAVNAGTGISGGGTTGDVTITNSMATTIDAKGDLIAGTANDTFARLAVGNNGETLVADSFASTGLRYSAIPGANLIAGSSFDIWQRGTGAFTANQAYTSDRFFTYSSSSYSLSQETSVIPEGATNAARITITSGGGFSNHQFVLEQNEVEKLAGKTVTWSVYLRVNATYNGTFSVGINTNTTGNTQTGGTWVQLAANSPITPSTSAYTRYSITATIPTTAKGIAFFVNQNSTLANNSIYYIALAKAEIGSTATTWSRCGTTLAGELAACQRYYWRSKTGTAYETYGTAIGKSATSLWGQVVLPVTMRIAPTSVDYANVGVHDTATGITVSSLSIGGLNPGQNAVTLDMTTAGSITQYRPYVLTNSNSTSGYIGFSAEL